MDERNICSLERSKLVSKGGVHNLSVKILLLKLIKGSSLPAMQPIYLNREIYSYPEYKDRFFGGILHMKGLR